MKKICCNCDFSAICINWEIKGKCIGFDDAGIDHSEDWIEDIKDEIIHCEEMGLSQRSKLNFQTSIE